jgi:hypothetical protein
MAESGIPNIPRLENINDIIENKITILNTAENDVIQYLLKASEQDGGMLTSRRSSALPRPPSTALPIPSSVALSRPSSAALPRPGTSRASTHQLVASVESPLFTPSTQPVPNAASTDAYKLHQLRKPEYQDGISSHLLPNLSLEEVEEDTPLNPVDANELIEITTMIFYYIRQVYIAVKAYNSIPGLHPAVQYMFVIPYMMPGIIQSHTVLKPINNLQELSKFIQNEFPDQTDEEGEADETLHHKYDIEINEDDNSTPETLTSITDEVKAEDAENLLKDMHTDVLTPGSSETGTIGEEGASGGSGGSRGSRVIQRTKRKPVIKSTRKQQGKVGGAKTFVGKMLTFLRVRTAHLYVTPIQDQSTGMPNASVNPLYSDDLTAAKDAIKADDPTTMKKYEETRDKYNKEALEFYRTYIEPMHKLDELIDRYEKLIQAEMQRLHELQGLQELHTQKPELKNASEYVIKKVIEFCQNRFADSPMVGLGTPSLQQPTTYTVLNEIDAEAYIIYICACLREITRHMNRYRTYIPAAVPAVKITVTKEGSESSIFHASILRDNNSHDSKCKVYLKIGEGEPIIYDGDCSPIKDYIGFLDYEILQTMFNEKKKLQVKVEYKQCLLPNMIKSVVTLDPMGIFKHLFDKKDDGTYTGKHNKTDYTPLMNTYEKRDKNAIGDCEVNYTYTMVRKGGKPNSTDASSFDAAKINLQQVPEIRKIPDAVVGNTNKYLLMTNFVAYLCKYPKTIFSEN